MTLMNDGNALPSATLKRDNYAAWVDRYQKAPSITPAGAPTSGGHGFIDIKDPDCHSKLILRQDELKQCRIPQDKERLALLVHAEEKAITGTQTEARKGIGALMAYDRANGHPVADPHRDLLKDPYSTREQAEWHRREGRDLTTAEMNVGNSRGWSDPNLHKDAKPSMKQDPEWEIHPKIRPARDAVAHQLSNPGPTPRQQAEAQAQSQKPSKQVQQEV